MDEIERIRAELWRSLGDYRAGDLSDDEIENLTNVLDSLADLARLSLQRTALEHATHHTPADKVGSRGGGHDGS